MSNSEKCVSVVTKNAPPVAPPVIYRADNSPAEYGIKYYRKRNKIIAALALPFAY